MKVVILAGGFGTRLGELTDIIPKPMIQIGGIPIIEHIMTRYARFGYKEFIVALGYKAEVIKEYFLKYANTRSDFTVDLQSGEIHLHSIPRHDWKITLVSTGLDTMTGGRVKRLKEYIGDSTFMLTYGDGLSNIDISQLVKFHKEHKKRVTVSAVRPVARFGELNIDGINVVGFKEKPQTTAGWVNGGFFVIEPEFINTIISDDTVLESYPLELAAKEGQLMAYLHEGFWQCMDTIRDKNYLEKIWGDGNAPWA
ncbi:glucose-1-phosphate cytidylyltransferase [Polynucleobacter sp. AP-Ainpum-60-G11]|uniref:glucose-1-phosphate cytidylyltransferase n=1 Tax=Polynucleobacter sp. AP-Ainpum-60-G11 TaxID=2576926 RepID=UPI001BFCF861|nr:glucose-1-phosphate cytidylyltransferase [Polynucleobacter sp. AP-Ainpum-60-G11]QWE27021.1 glucose-1-phosphate cytidylyltransferase [Polynucleobacter sp. AP-Ainpum-60-G11]